MNGQLGIIAIDIPDAEQPAARLSNDGTQRHAQHPHGESQHKQQIQKNVQNGGHHQEQQGGGAVAHAVEDTGVEVIADVADQSGAYHQQVSPGLRPRGRIHPQHGHQGTDQQQRNDRDGQDTADKGGIQAVDGVPHSFRLPCAERLGDDHRAAGGNAGEQGGEQEDHRESHAYGGQSRVADIVAHHPAVYHIVKLLQKVPCQQRQGKPHDMAESAALRHVADTAFSSHDPPHCNMMYLLYSFPAGSASAAVAFYGKTVKMRKNRKAAVKRQLEALCLYDVGAGWRP